MKENYCLAVCRNCHARQHPRDSIESARGPRKMAMDGRLSVIVFILTLFYCINTSISQVLTPPYFNLAYGRPIVATATCGEGVTEPELFCKLTGANPEREAVQPHFSVIQGQLCDVCDPYSPGDQQAHPASQAVDGTERWWQSPPLSRGPQFNQVNLTIDLQQVCEKVLHNELVHE